MRRYTDPGFEPPRNFRHHHPPPPQHSPDSSSSLQAPVYNYKQPAASTSSPRKGGKPSGYISQYQESVYNQHPHARLNYRIEIRSSTQNFKKHEVKSLLDSCKPQPNHFLVFTDGYVAARLFYKHRYAVLDALAHFWEKRLLGANNGNFAAHLMRNVGSDSLCYEMDDVRERLGGVFVEYCKGLLKGEMVEGLGRKVEEKSGRIKRVEWLLERPQSMEVWEKLRAEKKGLEEEVELIYMRLDEFKAGLECIIRSLNGGGRSREEDVEVLRLRNGNGNEVNWVEVHCCIMRECRRLEEGLPIYGYRREILNKIQSEQVMILVGETGSGKSTQLVQFLADSDEVTHKSIICTQPRKIAAITLAERVSEEGKGCYEENSVICYPTYSSYQGFRSKVIFMTDNCLLQHYMHDNNLGEVSHIIIDEAHERSLNTDLLLALVKGLLLRRVDLRLVIMSATADAQKLSDYFCGCGILNVVGRNFPVDIKYVPSPSAGSSFSNLASYVTEVIEVANTITVKKEEPGDILAFLTSQIEVEWACENFRSSSAIALPLHGKLSWEEQGRIFKNYLGKRKVIFSTNLAETSLTIPGVKFVIDCGMVKECCFEASSGLNVLKICRISQSSAKQRSGRAGRTEPGSCYRLYSAYDFELMPLNQEPEIRRVHLGVAVLRILSLGIKNIKDFDFIDAPSSEAINRAIKNLIQLGAITNTNAVFELTEVGRKLVDMAIEPRLGKLILDSFHHRLGKEGLVLAAVMANASSVFCRVGNEEDKLRSDRIKVQFSHPDGDLFTLLSVYKQWEKLPRDTRNKWCWDNSINAKSMRRCEETVQELEHCLKNELNKIFQSFWRWDPHLFDEQHTNLKKIILSSLAENVAMYSGYDRLGYQVALTGQYVKLHPSCSLLLYGQKPSWVVFGEMLSVSTEYLVCVSAFDYRCLSTLSPPPLFDVSHLENQKLQVGVIKGFGIHVLKRFCGKSMVNLLNLMSSIQTVCKDVRINIEVDFDQKDIQIFSSLEDMEKVRNTVTDALEYEKKSLRDECIEKCLYPGRQGHSPSVALFGAGGEIKHLELGKRFLSVEVFHSNPRDIDDKKLLLMFEKCTSGICNYHKYVGIPGHEGETSDKWGKITFLTPEAAEKAVAELNEIELNESTLRVFPTYDLRLSSFPAVKARVSWPRKPSKGVAIVKCAKEDFELILNDFSNLLIRERHVRCEINKNSEGSSQIKISGIDKDISEPEVMNHLRTATNGNILDMFLLRGVSVEDTVTVPTLEEALLKEFAPFMPTKNAIANCCRVQVFPPEQKDYNQKAMISFDGSLHLEAAKALDHIEGKVLDVCLPWQKIQVQHMFHSSVSCPAPVYSVIKTELDTLCESFTKQKGISCNLDRNINGSYRVKISSNATRTVAQLRMPLEQLMKGKTINHANLTPSMLQLIFSRDGNSLIRSLQRETGTFLLYDKRNLNIRIFGPKQKVMMAESSLIQSLSNLHDSKPLKINLRGRDLPHNLMKKLVEKFGPELNELKDRVPDAMFSLNTRQHILLVQGNDELKQKAEEIVHEIAHSLTDGCGTDGSPECENMCSICLCEVEDYFQLEACSHRFCRMCLVYQFESAVKNQDGFPVLCAQEGCRSPIFLLDMKSLLTAEKLEELFKTSLGAFVASSAGTYRFCPSPDCPAVYQVARPGMSELFLCEACCVETCTGCHVEYHPGFSCEEYKEHKENPNWSLNEWKRGQKTEVVKNCPACNFTIEKVEGCNHMICKCDKHICWVCLEYFDDREDCYQHLTLVHHSIYDLQPHEML